MGTPVVLSPICWFEPAALWTPGARPGRGSCGGLAAWSQPPAVPAFPAGGASCSRSATGSCPTRGPRPASSSRSSASTRGGSRSSPTACSARFGSASPELFRARYGDEDFVLFVGRIEPRKNPLGLIRAVRSLGLPLVSSARRRPESRGYLEQCRDEGGEVVSLAGASATTTTRCWPRPTRRPGSSPCRAGSRRRAWPRSRRRSRGRAVVITPFGSTREYFGDRVDYARPDRVGEIARAVARCWSHGPDPRLAGFVASNYLWPDVAKRTAEVYDQVAS